MTAIGAGRARRAGQPSRLVINVSSPFRLDYVVWALRRRAHNEVDRFDAGCYRRVLSLALASWPRSPSARTSRRARRS